MPACVFMLLGNLLQVSNAIFIGQAGGKLEEISGIGLGNTFCFIFFTILVTGLNNSVETLVAQSFGAQEYELAGEQFKRGRFIV